MSSSSSQPSSQASGIPAGTLCVDVGNSRVKLGFFLNGRLKEVLFASHQDFAEKVPGPEWLTDFGAEIQYLALSSVGNSRMTQSFHQLAASLPHARSLVLDRHMRMPIGNGYATPETLGLDRLCSAVGAWDQAEKGPLLVIDAGTAITYEYVDAGGTYQGGGIAPGIRLRFQALNDHTAALPLVPTNGDRPLVGYDTTTSIRSGVVNGILAELQGIISQYRELAGPELQVFITGGDAVFLGNHLKNINFVDPDLLLKGINALIKHNLPHA